MMMTRLIWVSLLIVLAVPWCLKTTISQTSTASDVSYNPAGTYLVVTSPGNNAVYIYDTTNYFLQFTYPATNVVVARFSKNGLHIGVGFTNGRVDLLTGVPPFSATPVTSFTPLTSKIITDLDFNWNNNMLVTCYSDDDNFVITDSYTTATSGSVTTRSRNTGRKNRACKWSKNNDVVVANDNKIVQVYAIPAAPTAIPASTSTITGAADFTDVAIKPTTNTPIKIVASGGNNAQKMSSVFLNSGGSITQTDNTYSTVPTAVVSTACYGGDGLNYATGGVDKKIWVWQDGTDYQSQVLYDGINSITSCHFSYDGQYLAAGTQYSSSQGFVYIYARTCFFCSPGYYVTGLGTCGSCSTSMTSCSMCSNSTYCVACFQGYYLNTTLPTTCYTCNSQMLGCSTCQSATVCIQCDHGYYLNGAICSTCASLFTGCMACNSTVCYICNLDYYKLANNTCSRCATGGVANCLRCNASNNCLQCAEGYFGVGVTTCTACDVKCLLCYATATNCSLCSRGYYLSGNTCTPCSTNCLECTSSACLDCAEGYFVSGTSCTACTQPCSSCVTAATTCLSCIVGYYYSANTCTACTNNCSICSTSTNCSGCNIGYYQTATNTCLACPILYTGCSQCILGTCYACDQTRYLVAPNTCTICNTAMPGCQYCSTSTACTLCGIGYYHTGVNGSTSCAKCASQCQICSTSSTTCSSCVIGYFLSTTTCTLCIAPCSACMTTGSTCLSCISGYYLNINSCVACTSLTNCLVCLNNTYCIQCQQGFYQNSGSCTACPSNCLQCNSTNCFSCNVGYYIASALVCSPCNRNCSTCLSNTVCQSCNVGFYFDTSLASNQCKTCALINSACLTCNDTACFSCASGFYLMSGNCNRCSVSVTYCAVCSAVSTCTLCQDGYYLASATSCVACSTLVGCLECSGPATCNLCAVGYYPNGGACVACPANCSSCASATSCDVCSLSYYLSGTSCPSCQAMLTGCQACSSSSTCLSCGGGYLLSGVVCQPCSTTLPACSLCTVAGVCQSCQQGYFLNGGNTCQLCSSSASLVGCLLCNTSAICQSCQTGYYLSGGLCYNCSTAMAGCTACSAIAVCVDCDNGYYLNTTSTTCLLCQSNLPGCIFCSSNNTCIQCQSGYYLNGANCQACPSISCQICDSTTPANCITCNSGYYLSGVSCLTCPQVGCLNCDNTSCLTCQSGYYLSGSSCTLCSTAMDGCSKCSNATTCQQCQSLFYLSGSSCVVCSSTMVGCSFCSSSSVCLACDGGYYLNGMSCTACSAISGCLICNGSSSCLTCTAGYYQINNTCILCSSSLTNCFQCFNNTACYACQSGYQKSASGGCQAMQLSSGSTQYSSGTDQLTFKSYYVSKTRLRHALAVKNKRTTYKNVQKHNWKTDTKIYVQTKSGSTLLAIQDYALSGDACTMNFYTANPIEVVGEALPIASGGRILAGQSINQLLMMSSISLPKSIINDVLPSILVSTDLTMSYDLDNTEFYVAYVREEFQLYYFIFGISVVAIFVFYGFCRATCLAMYARNIEILGHLLALKTISLIIYPTYVEYVNFCLGFMVLDLPWLNLQLPSSFANEFDVAPTGYFFYFANMNFGAMHFFTMFIFAGLLALGYCLLSDSKTNEIKIEDKKLTNIKFKAFKQFIFNVFGFGFAFAGFSSIVGAFLNYTSILTVNGIFYILGVIVYGMFLSEAFSCIFFSHRVSRLRVVLKASFLAAGGLNPLYLSAVAIIVDCIFIGVEYRLRRQQLVCPYVWLLQNILAVGALFAYLFIPDSYLTLVVVIILVLLILISEVYMYCKEKGLEPRRKMELFEQEQTIATEGHFWNLDQKHVSEVDLSSEKSPEKKSPKHVSKDDFVFEISKIGEDQGNNTMTTNFSHKPFEPKRRTRKFRQQHGATNSSWNKTTNEIDDIVFQQ